jgi:hypothetical protein
MNNAPPAYQLFYGNNGSSNITGGVAEHLKRFNSKKSLSMKQKIDT